MPINIALTAFDVCMLFLVIGLLACWLAVLPREEGSALETSVLRLLGFSIALLTLSSAGILLSRILELDGHSFPLVLSSLKPALQFTHYGHVWIWRIPALLLLWLAGGWSLHHRHHTWAAWLMVIAAAGIALTRSETGHPADHGDFTFAVWMDWVHLMSAAVWVGSLLGMSLVIFPKLLRGGDALGDRCAVIFQRLSTLSGIALVLILATGIYTAVSELGSFRALWTTGYGITLDVKLGIVVLMILFGAHNRYLKLPRLLHAAGKPVPASVFGILFGGFAPAGNSPGETTVVVRSCARAVLAEAVLGVAVIVAASVLLHGMPPAEMPKAMAGMSMSMNSSRANPLTGAAVLLRSAPVALSDGRATGR
ncbi:MAG: CopD family protein [Gammaproteobacteria bacterium]|nr:CopD family protein [Gammaproteobacteria bacterium]